MTLEQRFPRPYFSLLVAEVAAAKQAYDGDVCDLARGNPDVPTPQHVVDELRRAAGEPGANGYPAFAGLAQLREAFCEHQRSVFGVELDPEHEVVVVPGTKTGIVVCAMALAQPGQTVLLPDPGYPDYPSGVAFADAVAAPLPLDPARGFAPDYEGVGDETAQAAAMTFLNYPSNPCGTAATPELFAQAVAWSRATGTPIVHDLAYGELVYDGRPFLSFLSAPGAKDVGVELVSMSKTWGMAGWRLGFVCGNAGIVERVKMLLDHLAVGVYTPIQRAGIAALLGPQDYTAELRELYAARSRRVADALGIAPAEGSYYLWWKLPPHLDFATLLHEHRVAVAPGWGFGASAEGWARISVAVDDEQLDRGIERLVAAAAGESVRLSTRK